MLYNNDKTINNKGKEGGANEEPKKKHKNQNVSTYNVIILGKFSRINRIES